MELLWLHHMKQMENLRKCKAPTPVSLTSGTVQDISITANPDDDKIMLWKV